MGMAMGGPGGGPTSEINVTPMIDVLLVLLIIFMVITPLTPKGLEALVPQPPPDSQKSSPPPPERTIVVQLLQGAGGQPALKINQDDSSWATLKQQLEGIYKLRAEKVMFVRADDELPFSDVAQVIDIGHAAGVDKIGLITAQIEAGQ